MIQETIKNTDQELIGEVVDRDNQSNGILTINARNVNPCAIDLRFISRQIEECGGVYLMWLNTLGGWSSHLFHKAYERDVEAKSRGEVQRYYDNRANARHSFASLGVEAYEEWTLVNSFPYESEAHRLEIESLILSNQVYLYMDEQFSGGDKFILVNVKDGKSKTKENSLVFNEFSVTIQLPKINTITL